MILEMRRQRSHRYAGCLSSEEQRNLESNQDVLDLIRVRHPKIVLEDVTDWIKDNAQAIAAQVVTRKLGGHHEKSEHRGS